MLLTILEIAKYVIGFFAAAIPAMIGLIAAMRAKKAAKTKAEAEVAKNDMLQYASMLIVEAENLYKSLDTQLKELGDSAGPIKKDTVMTKLQAYAISKSYAFDKDYWSQKIDDEVAITKSVNGKN